MTSTKKILFIGSVCVSLFALTASGDTSGTSGNGGANSDSSQSNPAENDVAIAECTTDSLGSPEAQVKITNNSSKPSNYIINIAFESSDGATQIDTSMVAVNNLQPGQSATEKAVSFSDAPRDFVCKVAGVTRYAS